jgi:hypothetical protein
MLQQADHARRPNELIPGPDHTQKILEDCRPATRFLFSASPTLTRSPDRGVTGGAQGTGPRRAVIVCSWC